MRRAVGPETRAKLSLALRGRTRSPEHCAALSAVNLGRKHTVKSRANMSIAHRGKKRPPFTPEHRANIAAAKRGRSRPDMQGSAHWHWLGGITTENQLIRTSPEMRAWRTSVFEKDNYTCVHCGTRRGPFNADHIQPFALYPELRFSLDNGRTLCVPCHRKTTTYGGRTRRAA